MANAIAKAKAKAPEVILSALRCRKFNYHCVFPLCAMWALVCCLNFKLFQSPPHFSDWHFCGLNCELCAFELFPLQSAIFFLFFDLHQSILCGQWPLHTLKQIRRNHAYAMCPAINSSAWAFCNACASQPARQSCPKISIFMCTHSRILSQLQFFCRPPAQPHAFLLLLSLVLCIYY